MTASQRSPTGVPSSWLICRATARVRPAPATTPASSRLRRVTDDQDEHRDEDVHLALLGQDGERARDAGERRQAQCAAVGLLGRGRDGRGQPGQDERQCQQLTVHDGPAEQGSGGEDRGGAGRQGGPDPGLGGGQPPDQPGQQDGGHDGQRPEQPQRPGVADAVREREQPDQHRRPVDPVVAVQRRPRRPLRGDDQEPALVRAQWPPQERQPPRARRGGEETHLAPSHGDMIYQPRSRHSGRCGRSTPSVESLPWPG